MWECSECCLCCLTESRGCCFYSLQHCVLSSLEPRGKTLLSNPTLFCLHSSRPALDEDKTFGEKSNFTRKTPFPSRAYVAFYLRHFLLSSPGIQPEILGVSWTIQRRISFHFMLTATQQLWMDGVTHHLLNSFTFSSEEKNIHVFKWLCQPHLLQILQISSKQWNLKRQEVRI